MKNEHVKTNPSSAKSREPPGAVRTPCETKEEDLDMTEEGGGEKRRRCGDDHKTV